MRYGINIKHFAYLLCGVMSLGFVQPTGKIIFRNPSFEDTPRQSASPVGWTSSPESTPDIQPGAWDVACQPQDGKSCVGLVTREDGTREDISQAMSSPLKKGICYEFSMFLAHAPKYVGHNQSVRLRVWGGSSKGAKAYLLDSSPLITHSDWKNYSFSFTPPADIKYLTFEASFGAGITFFYKGNVLLDNCSVIETCERA